MRKREMEQTITELRGELAQEKAARDQLTRELESARAKVAELEQRWENSDFEQLKRETRAREAEYEGLKELYHRKNEEFDSQREEREQAFAREAAAERFSLEEEIHDNRQANMEYVTRTVKTFGESYNYYLNQIRALMDALGAVATRTGAALFSGDNEDLKTKFGLQMVEELKAATGDMDTGNGDLMLIGSAEALELAEDEQVLEEEISGAVKEAAAEKAAAAPAEEEVVEEIEEIPAGNDPTAADLGLTPEEMAELVTPEDK